MDQYHRPYGYDKMLTTSIIETPTYADKSGYLFSLFYTNVGTNVCVLNSDSIFVNHLLFH